MLLGIHLTLMIGPTIAVFAPPLFMEALANVEVRTSDQGRSVFQITFQVGRAGPLDLLDHPLLLNPLLLRPFNRVVIVVTFNVMPRVLFDGVITNVQLAPNNEPGQSTLTVTGEDISLMLDRQDQQFPWPSVTDDNVVRTVLLKYAQYAIAPTFVFPMIPPRVDPPTRNVPVQANTTDLRYITCLAARNGYVFYIKPGPAPNTNVAYWGPPEFSFPQKSLSVNMGPDSNVNSINFSYDALAPRLIEGRIQDSETNVAMPIRSLPMRTRVPMAREPAHLVNLANVRRSAPPVTAACGGGAMGDAAGGAESECGHARSMHGLDFAQAQARAQAALDASTDEVVTATGELDALQYGNILEARNKVCLRGAGQSYDGLYRVKDVTHTIRRGEYKQRFTLTREGTGTLTPLCP
ncbi:MAG: hypothetical protein ACJ74W_23070 [Pyrinomonadaceae bacterium]